MLLPDSIAGLPVRALTQVSDDEAGAALTRSFEGYVVPMSMDGPAFAQRFNCEHIDAAESLLLGSDDRTAIAVIARRGTSSRLAAMAISPALRGSGVGSALLQTLIQRARERGDRRMLLEVIEQNEPALRLYRKAGFAERRRLVGFARAPLELAPVPKRDVHEIDLVEAARRMTRDGADDLPWLLDPVTIAGLLPPYRAVAFGPVTSSSAIAVFILRGADLGALRILYVPRAAREHGEAGQLLHALINATPRHWSMPAIVPQGLLDRTMQAAGFARAAHSQLEMELAFGPPAAP